MYVYLILSNIGNKPLFQWRRHICQPRCLLTKHPVSPTRTGQENRLISGHRGRCLNGGQKFWLFYGRRRLKVARGQEKGHFYGHSIEFKDD